MYFKTCDERLRLITGLHIGVFERDGGTSYKIRTNDPIIAIYEDGREFIRFDTGSSHRIVSKGSNPIEYATMLEVLKIEGWDQYVDSNDDIEIEGHVIKTEQGKAFEFDLPSRHYKGLSIKGELKTKTGDQ